MIGLAMFFLGLAVIALLGFSRPTPQTQSDGYELVGVFKQADGVGLGSEVRLAGLPVGRVVGHTLDEHYRAVLTVRLDRDDIILPEDTAAKIETDGLLGAKYIELEPGGAFDMLSSGDRLSYTQDAVIVEELLATIVSRAKVARGLDPSLPLGGN